MRHVLDSSIAIKTVVIENDTPQAVSLFDEYRRGLHELLAPDLFPFEIGNALTRAERRRIIAEGDAAPLLAKIMKASPTLYPSLPLLARSVELSSQFHRSVYDCLYIALAEQEQCTFLTADKKLFSIANVAPFPPLP